MQQTIHSKPEKASVTTLRRFFSNSPNSDVVTVEEVLTAYNRTIDDEHEKANRSWLSNKLVALRKDGLVTSIYSLESYRVLRKIQLTEAGKAALNRTSNPSVNRPQPSLFHPTASGVVWGNNPTIYGNNMADEPILLESILGAIATFESQNPSIELKLSINVRERR